MSQNAQGVAWTIALEATVAQLNERVAELTAEVERLKAERADILVGRWEGDQRPHTRGEGVTYVQVV